jgi:hypothetical protein
MSDILANEFSEINSVLLQNEPLRNRVITLIENQPIAGKVTEGIPRLEAFRAIMVDLVNGNLNLNEAIQKTQIDLSPQSSAHGNNIRVFPANWDERLVRTQLSRFYNQAVMEQLLEEGETQCFVPHSSEERADSDCSSTSRLKFLSSIFVVYGIIVSYPERIPTCVDQNLSPYT